MTRDEVLAMTDEQLRIKAAELMGWTWAHGLFQAESGRTYKGLWAKPRVGDTIITYPADTKNCIDCLPDYPNDIAAAMSVEPILNERGLLLQLFQRSDRAWFASVANRVTWEIMSLSLEIEGIGDQIGTPMGGAKNPARAITRIFVFAMDAS